MHFGFPVCIIPIFIHVPNVFIQNRDTLFCVVFRCASRSTHIQRDKEREQEARGGEKERYKGTGRKQVRGWKALQISNIQNIPCSYNALTRTSHI